jgi:WD40 repeat protein
MDADTDDDDDDDDDDDGDGGGGDGGGHGGGGHGARPLLLLQGRRVFVGTDEGQIFQVHGPSAALQVIYKVHNAAINSMQVNESFCVTGSDDSFVRVWPLDFVDYFLEAHHDAAITSMDVSSDGLHIAIGTEQGAIGLLSVGDQVHRNVLRSHSDTVTGLGIDIHDSMAATAAADGTIRVWSLREPRCQQLYEIEASGEAPRCVTFRPDPNAEAAHVACGFDSGTVRIFVVEHTKLLHEYCQHKAGVYDVCFANEGQHLLSLSLDDILCIYDVNTAYQPMKLIPLRGPAIATSWPLPATALTFAQTGLTMAVSADTQLAAAVAADGTELAVINALICQRVATFSLDHDSIGKIVTCCFAPSGGAEAGRPSNTEASPREPAVSVLESVHID